MLDVIKHSPAVFAVGDEYKIFIPVSESSVMWVKVGDECYYDHSNGVLRSAVSVHKVTVPMESLDRERKYTVCYRRMIERKPYFSETGEIEYVDFEFSPLPEGKFNAYHLADAHGMVAASVATAKSFEKKYGAIDLLILNGDVIDHSGAVENFDAIYEISALITGGRIPVIFSRGNHDTRGVFAEAIADYTPTRDGSSYFSFRLGSLWGLVLDCGEDKPDSNPEYGNTNCCHAFRRNETKYIESVIKNSSSEYAADGVKRKLIIAHSPFTRRFSPPFNIEEDTYTYWSKLLSEYVKPDLMLSGHTHTLEIGTPGDENDAFGQPCALVIASRPDRKRGTHAGGGFIFEEGRITVVMIEGDTVISETVLNI